MKFSKKILAALALLTLPTVSVAQTAPPAQAQAQAQPQPARPDADPALWVVRDADTTIYLFGTFHLLDGRQDWFNDEVRTAFDASSELVMEVILPENQAEMQPLLMRYAVDPQGRTVSSRLTAQENAALRAAMGPMADALDQARFEPWFFMLTLTNLAATQMGLSAEHGPETVLRRAATERRMPIGALETIEGQLQVFDSMSEQSQMKGLRETIGEPERLRATLQPMLAAWSTGNIDQLAAIMTDQTREDPEMHAALFTRRNANWAAWIRERMARPGTVFLAVGAGHLGGPGSVQDQLRAMNIQSARVPAQ